MTSGVKCSDKVMSTYEAMKLVKNDTERLDQIRIIVFEIDNNTIEVVDVYKQKDLEDKEDIYKFFASLFRKNKCNYFLYDCNFKIKDTSPKSDLVFIMWAPDDAPMKDKMLYSSSKESITKVLSNVKHKLELHTLSDVLDKDEFTERLGKGVVELEGHPVK